MKNNIEKSSRYISLEILKKIFTTNSFSNILLNEVSNDDELENKYKNLIFAIVHGTVTMKIYLEYISNKLINPKKTPIDIQIILWMSLYQIKFMNNIPQYAVVNEAVNLAKLINPKFGSLVNGTLKNLIRQIPAIYEVDIKNEDSKFCVENAFPTKLFKLIKDGYGVDKAKIVVLDSIIKPEINFRVNTLKASVDDVYEEYKTKFGLSKVEGVKDCLISKKPILKTSLYGEGKITIQDKASILVSQILNPSLESRVLDMCSAPGGKLTHLAAIMQNTGYIKAYELSRNRIKLIEDNLKRLDVKNVELVNENAENAVNDQPYDYILLDAPCSGFGVLRRKPEIKLNIDGNDLTTLYETQKELLEVAYKALKPNGEMVYSTCTININENQNQIDYFLEKHNDMEILEIKQLFGNEMSSDGFFICKMKKKEVN